MMKLLGDTFEERACAWLVSRGWLVVSRNFRCKVGELDIVALDADVLVFVEVRARTRGRFASAAGSIDSHKRRRLVQTSQFFLLKHPRWSNYACRFDVIAFDPPQSSAGTEPHWIRSAFTA
ncbi:MAG: YraN family protein [Halioglobus sp.]